MKSILLGLLLINVVTCFEFQMFEGKIADPCNRFVDPISNKDCPADSQWPASTNTVLIPSASSTQVINPAGGTTPVLGNLYGTQVTITGNFPPLAVNPPFYWALALATSEDSCSKIDFKYNYILLNTANIRTNMLLFTILGVGRDASSLKWDDPSLEIEDRPRLLCFTHDLDVTTSSNPVSTNWRYTGFKIGVVWNCGDPGATLSCGDNAVANIQGLLSPLQYELRRQRSYCCKRDSVMPGANINAGQCINPNVQTCCGAAQVEIAQEKCCNPTIEMVSQVDNLCPCASTDDCPTSERCCLPTKYSQFNNLNYIALPETNAAGQAITTISSMWQQTGTYYWPFFRGQCYRPTQYHCCDTGSVFDPGSHQCCKINGIQSINTPCPCNADSDCVTQHLPAESRTYNFTCCAQTAVSPYETSMVVGQGTCNIYANYPSGQGAPEIQRCPGVCIDPRYQFCCNGAVCMASYERCCNSSCCNIWTSTCFYALRSGSRGSRNNYISWNVSPFAVQEEVYEQCSDVEHLTTTKAFWVFVLPAMLLLFSFVGLALVMVFAAKATPRSFSKIELAMMGVALLTAHLSMPLYFAPVWKYGIWVIFAQLVVFVTATARIHWLNILCLVIQFLTLVYLFDPFHGNAFLTLSSNRIWGQVFSAPDDVMSSGVLHAIVRSWHTVDLTATQQYCYKFYDYFLLDPTMRDLDRWDNPSILTFGYCSRGWVTALLIFSFFVMTLSLIQIILTLLGLFYRFHTDSIFEQGYYEPASAPEAEQYFYQ